MKVQTIVAALQAIHNLQQAPQYVALETKDSFFLEECTERYVAAWKRLSGEQEVVRVTSHELYTRRGDLQGFPSFFGTKCLWVVALDSGKQKKDVVGLIREASNDNYFICFAEEGVPKELIDDAEQNGLSIVIPAPKPWERAPFLTQWAQGYCQKQKKTIEKEAAALLVNSYLSNRNGLVNELDKLILYRMNEPTITLRDIEQLACLEDQSTMWQLLEALLSGDRKALIQSMVATDEWNEIALLRFLKGQLEKLVIASEERKAPKNKSQERQIAYVERRGAGTILSWINEIGQREIDIRSGIEEASVASLLPFFVSLMYTHPS